MSPSELFNANRKWYVICCFDSYKLIIEIRPMLCEPSNSTLLRLLSLYQKNLDTRLEKECKKLLRTYPKSVVLRNLIGAAYTRLEKYDEALRVFQKAIELNPK